MDELCGAGGAAGEYRGPQKKKKKDGTTMGIKKFGHFCRNNAVNYIKKKKIMDLRGYDRPLPRFSFFFHTIRNRFY